MTPVKTADPQQDQPTPGVVSEEAEEGLGRLNEPPKTPSVTDQWFIDLVNRWRNHLGLDLKLRFETGVELNRRIGSPMERQERFGEVVTALAAQLQVHPSEVSRMRNFAALFSEFKVFQMEHPDVKTWSDVKARLPEWSATAGGESPVVKSRKAGGTLDTIVRSIRSAATQLDDNDLEFDEIERRELLLEIAKLGRSLERRLGIELTTVEIPHEDSTAEPQLEAMTS